MDPAIVLLVQSALALWGIMLVARRFAIPMLERHPVEDALCLLCLFHSFRYVALGVFAPGQIWPPEPMAITIGGDLTSSALALLAALMLHARIPGAIQLAWVFNLVGLADLMVSAPGAIEDRLVHQPMGLGWMIFVYYVPALLVTHLMMLGWLYRHAEARSAKAAA